MSAEKAKALGIIYEVNCLGDTPSNVAKKYCCSVDQVERVIHIYYTYGISSVCSELSDYLIESKD